MNRPRIFLSYARADAREFARELRLRLEAEGLSVWQDITELEGGPGWWNQIDEALRHVEYLVLVLTPEALRSDIVEKEWRLARQRGVCVVPVFGPVQPDLSRLPHWIEKPHIVDVTIREQWRRMVHMLEGPCRRQRVPFMAADLPADFIPRPRELEALREDLLSAGTASGRVAISAALRGAGGYGKTTLALALCHDRRIQEEFPDGILWVTLGREPGDLPAKVTDLIETLSGERPGFRSLEAAAVRLAEELGERRLLIVIDDVWKAGDAEPFLRGGPNAVRLLTTRDARTLPPDCREIPVDAMETAEAAAKTLALSLEQLSGGEQAGFGELAIFPEDTAIPIEMVARLWAATGAVSEVDAEELCQRLFELSLLSRLDLGARRLELHDVVRAILRQQHSAELAEWNRRLLDAVRPAGGWPELPRGESYLWENLAWHLMEAGRGDELRALLLDFSWLEAKLEAGGPAALVADYAYFEGDQELDRIAGALRLSSHVLAHRPGELAAQLLGRLARPATGGIEALLAQAQQRPRGPWLRPLRATLTPPGGPLIRTLVGHIKLLTTVAVTAYGRRAVSGSSDKTLKLWDLESGRELYTLKGHSQGVTAVAVTADGRRAVSGSEDTTLKVWDLESGRELATLEGHSGWVRAVAVTPDGRRAVSGSDDKTVKVWDLESGRELVTLRGHSRSVKSVAVTADGRRAVSGSRDGTLKVWDLGSRRELATLQGHSGEVRAVAVTPDGRRAVSASDDKTVKVWDLESGRELATLQGHSGSVESVAVTADGRRAVSGSVDETLKVWDLESGREVATLEGHSGWVRAVAVTPDGRRAVSGSDDKTLKVWDLENGRELASLQGHSKSVKALAVTRRGWRAVSTSRDGTASVWDPESGREVAVLRGHLERLRAVAVTPDGRRAVSGSGDHTVRVWDLESGRELTTLHGHSDRVTAVAVTADGRRAVSGSDDKTLKVWDLESDRELATLKGNSREITAVAVTDDGRRAVSGCVNGKLKVWRLDSGRLQARLRGHSRWVNSVAVTADGRRAVSGSYDGTLKVWELESGRELATLQGHSDWVLAVAVTPDGRRAVSGSDDGAVRVWDLESGRELATFTTDGAITCCAVTPDGARIFAGDGFGRVHLLELIER